MTEWLGTLLIQIRNSAPVLAAIIADWFGDNIDEVYKYTLFFYAALQISYLTWKWVREARNGKQT